MTNPGKIDDDIVGLGFAVVVIGMHLGDKTAQVVSLMRQIADHHEQRGMAPQRLRMMRIIAEALEAGTVEIFLEQLQPSEHGPN